MVKLAKHPEGCVKIAMVGKYVRFHDAYLSVTEALRHAGYHLSRKVKIRWVDSETLNEDNIARKLKDVDGILVPGGFGDRGIEGMILTARYARENKIPYLGICLGMQVAVIECARSLCGWKDANSREFDPDTSHPVIDFLPEQNEAVAKGGTLRLGAYPCILEKGSRIYDLYHREEISERHRHRYEFSNLFREDLQKAGLVLSGLSPDRYIVETVEYEDHPYFVAVQFHSEFLSRPNRPHPLFTGLIEASIRTQGDKSL